MAQAAVVFVAVSIAAALLFLHSRRLEREKLQQQQAAFDAVCLEVLKNGLTVEDSLKISRTLTRAYPAQANLIGMFKQAHESITLALTSKVQATAESRMTYLEDHSRRIIDEHASLVSPFVIDALRAAVADTGARFQTVLYLNVSRGHVEKALTLKTDKAKRKHLELAREALQRGIALGTGDVPAIKNELSAVDERIGSLK